MKEFLNEPVTMSSLLAMYAGIVLGKIAVMIRENKRFEKAKAEWEKRNKEWIKQAMRDAGYRD